MDKTILIFVFTQVVTAIGIIAAIKTDITWLKKTVDKHDDEISELQKQSCHN